MWWIYTICFFLLCVIHSVFSTLHLLSSLSVMKVKDGLVLLVYSAVCVCVMNESCPPRETLQKSIKEGIAVGGGEMDGEVKLKE